MTQATPMRESAFPIVIVGHVDHGKSTLIGRLLHDTDSLPTGKLEELKTISAKRGETFEWSFVLDALQIERDQGITVDTTQIWFKTPQRQYVIIDAPGHKEFLKNMVTGAASADAAVIVIDAEQGVSEQTRRHSYLLHILGIRQVMVVVNKIDLIDYDEQKFTAVREEIEAYLKDIGLTVKHVIPVSARHGDYIAKTSKNFSWFKGPTILEALDSLNRTPAPVDRPARFPIQDVYRWDDKRYFAGRLESGTLQLGDSLSFWPGGRTASITSFETWNQDTTKTEALAGESIAITLSDEIFVERGHIGGPETHPPRSSQKLSARLFWLAKESLHVGDSLKFKLATAEYKVTVETIDQVIDVQDLSHHMAQEIKTNDVAEITLRCHKTMAFDMFGENNRTGRAVLIREHHVAGGCIIEGLGQPEPVSENITEVAQSITPSIRAKRTGHKSGVLWFTGLSGSGKSTLSMALQKHLFENDYQVYTLDGDNIRGGLNRDLGFTEQDRSENLRRIAEVAKLFADSGAIVITSFISPTRADRNRAREIVGNRFHEIYINADLKTCEERDTKDLYKRARAGEIENFTGISAPWEPPVSPDLELKTTAHTVEDTLQNLVEYVVQNFKLDA